MEYPPRSSRAVAQSLPSAGCSRPPNIFSPFFLAQLNLLSMNRPQAVSPDLAWTKIAPPSLGSFIPPLDTILSFVPPLIIHPTPSTKAQGSQNYKAIPNRYLPKLCYLLLEFQVHHWLPLFLQTTRRGPYRDLGANPDQPRAQGSCAGRKAIRPRFSFSQLPANILRAGTCIINSSWAHN